MRSTLAKTLPTLYHSLTIFRAGLNMFWRSSTNRISVPTVIDWRSTSQTPSQITAGDGRASTRAMTKLNWAWMFAALSDGEHALARLPGELLEVHRAAPIALHEADGGQHLLRGRGQVALPVPLGLGCDLDAPGEEVRDQPQYGNHREGDQGHAPGLVEEEGEAAHEHHEAAEDVADGLDHEVLDHEHVTGHPGQHIARALLVVVAQGQPLEVGVHLDPDAVAEGATAARHADLGERVRGTVHRGDQDDGHREHENRLQPLRRQDRGETEGSHRGLVALQEVDEEGHWVGLEDGGHRLDQEEHEAEHVDLAASHEPPEQPDRAKEVPGGLPVCPATAALAGHDASTAWSRQACASTMRALGTGERGARAKARRALRSRATASCQRVRDSSRHVPPPAR